MKGSRPTQFAVLKLLVAGGLLVAAAVNLSRNGWATTQVHPSLGQGTSGRIQQLVASTLPPGWEKTFVLHDALVVSASLTECARLVSFASSEGLAHQPRKALSGEALVFHRKLEGFALRWMLARHPGLGEPAIREILAADNHHVLPMLGPYNLLKGPEWIEALGIPVAPPETPSGF